MAQERKTGVNEKMKLQCYTSLVLSVLYHAGYYVGNECISAGM